MTFESRETSLADGAPIRLYEFQRGLLRWRYTNADRNIEFQAEDFEAIAITDNGIRQTGETSADELVISVPHDNPVAQLFRGVPPSDEIFVILRNLHHEEPESIVAGEGTIMGVRWPTAAIAEIRCQPISSSFERPGLRLATERGCPYSVYDHNCGLDPNNFRLDTIIQSLDGISIQSGDFAAQANGWWSGGYVQWSIGAGQFERRHVGSHVGESITLLGGTQGLSAGMEIAAFPGCARTAEVCHNKFDNLAPVDRPGGYGGFPHMPGKSPFDGDPLF